MIMKISNNLINWSEVGYDFNRSGFSYSLHHNDLNTSLEWSMGFSYEGLYFGNTFNSCWFEFLEYHFWKARNYSLTFSGNIYYSTK